MPPDLLPVWNSFCALMGHSDATTLEVIEWVRVHHWRESPAGIEILVDVMLALAAEHASLSAAAKEAPRD